MIEKLGVQLVERSIICNQSKYQWEIIISKKMRRKIDWLYIALSSPYDNQG